jgi:NAD(P)-dependent dehydrogenase (short-subunit alcohol dehydrogenase family)
VITPTVKNMAESSGQFRYLNKVAIVTGGSKGIGEGCVRVFHRHGAKVVFCARGEEAGKSLESELSKNGGPGEAIFIKCDVTSEADIKNVIEQTIVKYGQIDCLINNAGAHPPHQTIDEVSAEDFQKLFNLNVVSYFLFCKHALPHLRKTKGNIINDSSLVGMIGQVGAVIYCATKGAISAMGRALAIDEAKYGVRVNTISPGNVWTPMWNELAHQSHDPQSMIQEGVDAQLLGRMGTIEETGLLCLYLAAEATFITGVDIPISGGAELSYGRKTMIAVDKKTVFG